MNSQTAKQNPFQGPTYYWNQDKMFKMVWAGFLGLRAVNYWWYVTLIDNLSFNLYLKLIGSSLWQFFVATCIENPSHGTFRRPFIFFATIFDVFKMKSTCSFVPLCLRVITRIKTASEILLNRRKFILKQTLSCCCFNRVENANILKILWRLFHYSLALDQEYPLALTELGGYSDP
jgi:hypothetical protein